MIGDEAPDQSPAPAYEWRTLPDILGLDLLTRLLGISQSSARRYISGRRSTPDAVADRLHFLAFVVGDLAGAYNDLGVRRWFDRRRERLNGNTPAEELGDEWSPGDEAPQRVRELARASCHPPRRDRLPPRGSPLSILAGRFIAIRRKIDTPA